MQAAVAKGLGVDEDKVEINFKTMEVTVDLEGADLDMAALATGFEGTDFTVKN